MVFRLRLFERFDVDCSVWVVYCLGSLYFLGVWVLVSAFGVIVLF